MRLITPSETQYRPLLLEVGEEVGEFLAVLHDLDLPTFDLSAVVDSVISSFCSPQDPGDDFRTLVLIASEMAHGDLLVSGPIEACDGLSMPQRARVADAIQRLGWLLRARFMDLGLVDPQGRFFTHCFKELERDHLLKLAPVPH